MSDTSVIAAIPNPGVSRPHKPAPTLLERVEKILLDTSRNKDTRIRDAVTALRHARLSAPK